MSRLLTSAGYVNRKWVKDNVFLYVAKIAQLVEHLFEEQGVGGSIPPLGTKINGR